MGSRARDFSGNEVYDAERMPETSEQDIEDKLQELEGLISKCDDEAQALRDEAGTWEELSAEMGAKVEGLREKLSELEEEEDEDDGLHYNSQWGLHRLSEDVGMDDGS